MLKLHAISDTVPTINATEARWVASELSALLRQIDLDSPTGLVIQHARRELGSLIRSAESAAAGSAPQKVAA